MIQQFRLFQDLSNDEEMVSYAYNIQADNKIILLL